eukprot:scaffold166951_cov27-Tisochrysis_lutea.AAC.4
MRPAGVVGRGCKAGRKAPGCTAENQAEPRQPPCLQAAQASGRAGGARRGQHPETATSSA